MPSLLGGTISTPCERCGREFSFELWSVVDTEQRPDLAERARDSRIRMFPCPGCGEPAVSTDPLLIYQPSQGGIGALVLACSEPANQALVQKEATPLVAWLENELGVGHDATGVIPTPWELLGTLLQRNIQADLETPDAHLDLPPEFGASYREILGQIRKDRGLEWVTDLGDADLPPVDYYEHVDGARCTECGEPFKATIYMIVTDRPALADAVISGEVQSEFCPHCGERVFYGAMLFVWRPRRSPRILVSPGPGIPKEQSVEAATTLFGVLKNAVGAQFRDEWLSQARFLSREELGATLSATPS